RLPTGVRDPHAHNVGLTTAGDYALALRGCESGLDQFDHHVDREPVRAQDRLAVTVAARGKQFEGAAAVRIGAAIVASGRHRGTVRLSPRSAGRGSTTGRDCHTWSCNQHGTCHLVRCARSRTGPREKTQRLLGPSGSRKGGGWDRVNRIPRKPPYYNTRQSRQLCYVSRVSAKELFEHIAGAE